MKVLLYLQKLSINFTYFRLAWLPENSTLLFVPSGKKSVTLIENIGTRSVTLF